MHVTECVNSLWKLFMRQYVTNGLVTFVILPMQEDSKGQLHIGMRLAISNPHQERIMRIIGFSFSVLSLKFVDGML